jgi:hypothetical protein
MKATQYINGSKEIEGFLTPKASACVHSASVSLPTKATPLSMMTPLRVAFTRIDHTALGESHCVHL